MTTGIQIAFVSVLSLLGLVVCLPVLLVLFAAAYLLGATHKQRFMNMIAGYIFAVAATLGVALLFDPKPNSWADQHFTWIIVGIAPIAAGLGVATTVWYRWICRGKGITDR